MEFHVGGVDANVPEWRSVKSEYIGAQRSASFASAAECGKKGGLYTNDSHLAIRNWDDLWSSSALSVSSLRRRCCH